MFNAASTDQGMTPSVSLAPEQAVADTAKPVLTSLSLPGSIDVTNGGRSAAFSAGASDVGTGVDNVQVYFDRNWQGQSTNQNYAFFFDSTDSFSDGLSSSSEFFSSSSAAGTYTISSVHVLDKAGNRMIYNSGELASQGFTTSFQIVSNTAADTTKPVLTSLSLPSSVDVTSGGRNASFSAGASDVGTGVDNVQVYYDRNWQGQSTNQNYTFFFDSANSFSDGLSSSSEFFSSNSAAGTYNITSVHVLDKAGNRTILNAGQLADQGYTTSFQIISNTAADTTKPVLTSLSLPSSIDVTDGGRIVSFSAGASDVGTGVDNVQVYYDRSWQGRSTSQNYTFFFDSADSFSDGLSSGSEFFSSSSAAGTYTITSVHVLDKAGNRTIVNSGQLANQGFSTSFQIVDRNLAATATVDSVASVTEGNDGAISLRLTLKDVGSQTVNTNVTVSFAADQSTATNGQDATVTTFSGSYSVAQSPTGNYLITLPSSFVLDDLLQEGTETLAIRVGASGQVFDTGTDSTIVRVSILDNDRFGTAAADTLIGGGLNDDVFGLAGDDVIDGGAGRDRLFGGDGGDFLVGGAGVDRMEGGAGDDAYGVDQTGDTVIERTGEGYDTVYASGSFTLAAGQAIEVLSTADWGSSTGVNLFGNEFGNRIYGNAGGNLLIGGGGADYLAGLGGDDAYYVDSLGDVVDEVAGGGFDVVYATSSFALSAGTRVEILSTADQNGTTAIALVGSASAQAIYGNAGVNLLIGGGGADLLIGLRGDDLYGIDNAAVAIVERAGEGYDTVYAGASYTLGAGVSVEVLSADDWAGVGAFALTGNEGGNTLFGNAGANLLDGKDGADTLTGFGGADIFTFTTTLGAGNVDRIAGWEDADTIALDDAVFGALVAGALGAGAFARGAAAADADDRIVYDPATGALFYDADGTGAIAAVRFATLDANLALTASNFVVI